MTDRIAVSLAVASAPAGDVLVLPCSGADWPGVKHPALDGDAARRVAETAAHGRFSGSANATLPVLLDGGRLLVVVGMGARATTRALREAVAAGMEAVGGGKAWSVLVPEVEGGSAGDALRAAVEGVALGAYSFKATQTEAPPRPGACTFVSSAGDAAAVLTRARAMCEGVLLTRDLVNSPAEIVGPEELAAATRAAGATGGWKTHTWTGKEVEERGFGLLHGVGKASVRPSTFTVVDATGGQTPELALVGKGVVFDTGGLDIKTGGFMKIMRKDMGGAGTIVGALEAIGRIGTDLPFVALIPAAENCIGPLAMRPGDVLKAYDGQTVEIGNTDAEGRLLLGDSLCYGRELGAKRMLDVATLTGAARVALGPDVPALFGNDEDLVSLMLETSAGHDEMLWRMPLVQEYQYMIDTPFADMNNSGSDRRGGAITAALFLERFAKDTPWAHVDLNAWEDRGRPGTPRGANGMTVRTVAETVLRLGQG